MEELESCHRNSTGLEIKKHSSWHLSWDQIAQNSKKSIEIVEELCNLEQVTQVLWNLLSLSVKLNGLFYNLLVVSYFSLLRIIFLMCIVNYHSFYIITRALKAGHHLPSFPFYIFICSSHQHFRITTSHTEPTYHSPLNPVPHFIINETRHEHVCNSSWLTAGTQHMLANIIIVVVIIIIFIMPRSLDNSKATHRQEWWVGRKYSPFRQRPSISYCCSEVISLALCERVL